MRQKLLKVRWYKVLLSILIALCLGMGATFALSFSAYAEEDGNISVIDEPDPDEGGEPEVPEVTEIELEISVDGGGWVCKNYKSVENAILVTISDSTVDRTKISFNVYDANGKVVTNLNNFNTDRYGIINDLSVLKALNDLGVGTYRLAAEYQGVKAETTFKVSNGWKSAPHVIEWTYGEYNDEINPIRITAEALDGTVSYTVLNDEETAIEGLEGFTAVDGKVAAELKKLDAGTYYLDCSATGISEKVEFALHRIENKWKVVPSLNGWSEGKFDRRENEFNGEAEQGAVKFTVKDAKGKTLYTYNGGKLYNAQGNEVKTELLNDLSAGTYTLVAEIEGTVNYTGLKAEVQFSVLEDGALHGGIVAATVTFAVIDLIAAGVCIFLIIRRRKKVEDQFHKMVSKELRRR